MFASKMLAENTVLVTIYSMKSAPTEKWCYGSLTPPSLPPKACRPSLRLYAGLDLPNVPSEGWKKAWPALLLGYNAVVVWIGRKQGLIKNFFLIFYGKIVVDRSGGGPAAASFPYSRAL